MYICVCLHIYKSLSLLAWLRLMQFLIAFRELAAAAVFIFNFLLFDPTVHPNKHRFNIFTSFAQNLYLRLNLLENQVNEEIIQNISWNFFLSNFPSTKEGGKWVIESDAFFIQHTEKLNSGIMELKERVLFEFPINYLNAMKFISSRFVQAIISHL